MRKQKELNLEKNFSRWEKYFQMEQKTWMRCMIVTDKPDFNCFEYKIWKLPSLADPAVFQPFCCVSNVALRERANTAAAVIAHTQFFKKSRVTQPDNYWLGMPNWSYVTWLFQTTVRAPTRTCTRTVTEVTRLNLNWSGTACSGETRTPISLRNSNWCSSAVATGTECDKTTVADFGTVALPNRPADGEAGGSEAAAAGWAGPSQVEVILACRQLYNIR